MSRFLTRGTPVLASALAICALSAPLHGQSWRDKLKKKVEGAVGGAVDKAGGNGSSAAASATTAAKQVEETANVNYDFVPGSKVIFYDDFSQDAVGDIPTRLKLLSGNWEIAQYEGRKMLRCTNSCNVMVPLGTTLPEKFTFEADVIHPSGNNFEAWFLPPDGGARDGMNEAYWGFDGGIGQFKSVAKDETARKLYHARLMVDGEHAKVYINNQRMANVPEAKLGRSNAIWLWGPSGTSDPLYIVNIRVAVSEKSLFDALNADGRVATHGILFATGSDKIQAESGPTLKEIGEMLQQHGDLKLTIEGHTDNVGQPAANLTLSQKRADAVKQYLVSNYQIDAGRLETKGYGDTKPVAPNTSDDGRQQNRRVELVKM